MAPTDPVNINPPLAILPERGSYLSRGEFERERERVEFVCAARRELEEKFMYIS